MENFWLDLLKLFLQILFLLGATLTAIWFYQKLISRKQPISHLGSQNEALFFSLQLQACERLLLFLERISLSQMILRFQQPGMTVVQLQQLMIKTIREEFDYNLSQQLYVSGNTWEKIRHAREDAIRAINLTAARFDGKADARDFATALLQENLAEGKSPAQHAIDSIKSEPLKIRKP